MPRKRNAHSKASQQFERLPEQVVLSGGRVTNTTRSTMLTTSTPVMPTETVDGVTVNVPSLYPVGSKIRKLQELRPSRNLLDDCTVKQTKLVVLLGSTDSAERRTIRRALAGTSIQMLTSDIETDIRGNVVFDRNGRPQPLVGAVYYLDKLPQKLREAETNYDWLHRVIPLVVMPYVDSIQVKIDERKRVRDSSQSHFKPILGAARDLSSGVGTRVNTDSIPSRTGRANGRTQLGEIGRKNAGSNIINDDFEPEPSGPTMTAIAFRPGLTTDVEDSPQVVTPQRLAKSPQVVSGIKATAEERSAYLAEMSELASRRKEESLYVRREIRILGGMLIRRMPTVRPA